MKSVLFVCTANICRSPIAEGLFRDLVEKHGQGTEWDISSAGTWARDGMRAATNSELLLKDQGIDIGDHQSRVVTHQILANSDVVFTMEGGHKEGIQIEFPDMAHKIFMLSELAGYEFDVDDPIGRDQDAFAVTGKEINEYLVNGYAKIVELVSK